jgi:hypothetical protein
MSKLNTNTNKQIEKDKIEIKKAFLSNSVRLSKIMESFCLGTKMDSLLWVGVAYFAMLVFLDEHVPRAPLLSSRTHTCMGMVWACMQKDM